MNKISEIQKSLENFRKKRIKMKFWAGNLVAIKYVDIDENKNILNQKEEYLIEWLLNNDNVGFEQLED